MKKRFKYFLLMNAALIIMSGMLVNMASAQNWLDQVKSWTQSATQSATQSFQQTRENARQGWENFERQNQIHEKINNLGNDLSREAQSTYQSVRTNVDDAYNRYSPQAANALQRTLNDFKDTAPEVVENCNRVMGEWGENVGVKLSEYYRNYGKPAGDRLFDDMRYYSGEAREKIVASYAQWGPEVGNAIKDAYSRYSPQAADALQRVYSNYGPLVGTEIKAAYDKWNPQIAQGIHSAYAQYGTAIGEMVLDTYLQYNATIGEEIRNVYLPRIMQTISDERNQKLAIQTVSKVIDIYKNKDIIVHRGLKTLAEMPIKTRYGGTTSFSEESRKWIRTNCPALVGTDVEQDPAKVVTYVLLFPDKRVIFQDLKLIPGQNGQAVSCSEKLSEVSGVDVDQTIEVLDFMGNIEACSRGDVDPEFLMENAETIQKVITENNQRYS